MRMISPRVVCLAVVGLAACAPAAQQSPAVTVPVSAPVSGVQFARNPFASISTLPYHAPDFTKIREADYAPAFDAGMKQQIAQVDEIANQAAARSEERSCRERG